MKVGSERVLAKVLSPDKLMQMRLIERTESGGGTGRYAHTSWEVQVDLYRQGMFSKRLVDVRNYPHNRKENAEAQYDQLYNDVVQGNQHHIFEGQSQLPPREREED